MNATSSRAYHREIESALEDSFLRRTLDKFAVEYRESRDRAFSEIDGPALISAIAAAKDAAVSLKLIEARHQSPDHPILLNVPETDYLKFYLFQVV